MQDLLPFIIIGLTSGAVYGLAAVGLVLTYKTSGIFNFAHGALAAISAYLFYTLHVQHGLNWPLAVVVSVLVVGPIMGLLLEVLAHALEGASLAMRVASTVGLLLAIEASLTLIYGTATVRLVPVFLGSGTVSIDGTGVQWASIVTLAFALVVTAALSIFLRVSRHGVAMRAVVDNPDLLGASGTSPVATRRLAWIIGVTIASASGVLFASILPLNPEQLTLLVLAALGAAAIGGFSNLPVTLGAGLGIGVLASLCTKWFLTGLLAGLPPSLPFVVLFVVLMVFPKRYLRGRLYTIPQSRPTWTAPLQMQLGGGVLLLILLAVVPTFAGIHLTDWTTAVATTIVFMSLGLLVKTSGQVSLAQVSFIAIGAVAFSHLTINHGLPWFVALVVSGLIAIPVGAALSIPAIRTTGLYLALATFGFGILLQQMFYSQGFMFGPSANGLAEPRPELSWLPVYSDRGFYYLIVILATVTAGLVITLNRSRLGRLLRGMADSPTALSTSGSSVNVTRVLVFCLAAFLAAIGGALVGSAQGNISPVAYDPLLSLNYFVLIMLVLGGVPWYAVVAAGSLILIPSYIAGSTVSTILQLVFGASVIFLAFAPKRSAELSPLQRKIDSVFRKPRRTKDPAPDERRVVASSPPEDRVRGAVLQADRLVVRFGGQVALDGVSLSASTGRITGLIGPNGAGKTTLFNVCSGLIQPKSGAVLLDGHDVTRSGPASRARRGLGRTFQKMELLDSLTVRENVSIGLEASLSGRNPVTHLIGRPGDSRQVQIATDRALELCDLRNVASAPVTTLSTGQRRLVELARCIAGPFRILLLDEPSSGLDRVETERFGNILVRLVEERGCGILLVEHDMSLALKVCREIFVLDFGIQIFHGTPAELVKSPVVQAAYLGDAALEVDPNLTTAVQAEGA
jgi:ABC-type branched-subunit amino acid transport system ATPase component/branched-subunit amino acid ABC-type transport system permease component